MERVTTLREPLADTATSFVTDPDAAYVPAPGEVVLIADPAGTGKPRPPELVYCAAFGIVRGIGRTEARGWPSGAPVLFVLNVLFPEYPLPSGEGCR